MAQWHWDRYQYTGDKEWLRGKGYRYIKGVAEFYRTHGNFKKGADGKYHISNIGWAESVWGGMKDGVCDFATIRGVFPLAIKASEILGVDADLRPLWQDVLGNLAPYPTNEAPGEIGRSTCRGTAALPTPLASGRRRSMRGVGRTGACMTRGSCKSASTIW